MTRNLTVAEVSRLRGIFEAAEATEGRDAAIGAVAKAVRTVFAVPRVETPSPLLRRALVEILADAAKANGVTVDDIRGSSRVARVVRARWEAYWRLWRCNLSYQGVGAMCGGRDHAGVRHGILGFEDRLQAEPELRVRMGVASGVDAGAGKRRAA
jgi:chromosomal replication initiation ATPase DnaA